MSPKRRHNRRGRQNWIGSIISDPWRKLAAIGLALVVWFLIDKVIAEPLTTDFNLAVMHKDGATAGHKFQIQLYLPSTAYSASEQDLENVLDDSPLDKKLVTISFNGARGVIKNIRDGLTLELRPTEEQLRESLTSGYTFTKDDLKDSTPNRRAQNLIQSMEPGTIRLRHRRNSKKPIPLSGGNVNLEVRDQSLRTRIDENQARFDPSSATLIGPEEELGNITNETRLFRARIERATDNQASAVLELNPLYAHLKMEKDVTVTYKVRPNLVAMEFKDVPVLLDKEGIQPDQRKLFELDRQTVDITLLIEEKLQQELSSRPLKDLRAWVDEHLRLYVSLSPDSLPKNPGDQDPTTPKAYLMFFPPNAQPIKGEDYSEGDIPTVKVRRK